MSYHSFLNDDGDEYGSFEVFELCHVEARQQGVEPGWYWAAGFPGCLHDGEPSGPFETEQEAIDDAQNN